MRLTCDSSDSHSQCVIMLLRELNNIGFNYSTSPCGIARSQTGPSGIFRPILVFEVHPVHYFSPSVYFKMENAD